MADRPGLVDKLLGYFGLAKAASMTSQSYSATDPALVRALSDRSSSSGRVVTDDSAMANSTGWSCRRILAETIGSIPWGLYRKDRAGNATPADDHWLSDVLVDSPNAEMSDVEFREAMVLNLTGDGNAYALKETAGARVTSLTPIESGLVKPMQKAPGVATTLNVADGAVFFRYNDRGKPVDLPREKVFHVMGFSRNGLWGLSPIAHMREAMGMALAAEEFGGRFFSQGGMPSGTVSIDQWLTDENRKIARENLQQLVGGLGAAHRFSLLEGGMKLEPWKHMSLEDMQFLVLRKFSVLEICRFYRVPPHMVADLERATFSNIEHLSTEFVQYTLLPYFTRFEAAVKKWLLSPAERKSVMLKFNPEGLLRGDSQARAAFFSVMLQNGVMSRNEVRAKENLNAVPGLDGYTVQVNMTPVDRLDEIVDAQVEGDPAPAQQQPAPDTDARSKGKGDAAAPAVVVVEPRPPSEAGVTIALPELLKKDMKYTVDHPGVREMVKRQDSLDARVKREIESLKDSHSRALDQLREESASAIAEVVLATQKGIAEVARIASLPRVPVYDEKGEIIGAQVAERIPRHTH